MSIRITPNPFSPLADSPRSASPDRLDQSFSSASCLSISIDEAMDCSEPSIMTRNCQDLEFNAIVQGINARTAEFAAKALPRSKSLNEIFVIHAPSGPVAVFKPRSASHGSDMRMGLAGEVQDAEQNEVVAARLAQILTKRQIVPIAEMADLRLGDVKTIQEVARSVLEADAALLADDRAFVSGTIHKFVTGAQDLKSSNAISLAFFQSQDPEVQSATRMIAALYVLTCYLDGHMGNVMLNQVGSPVAVDFGDMMPSQFAVGARPPCWLSSLACSLPFSKEDVAEIQATQWSSIEGILTEVSGYSSEKINTMQLCYVLLQKGISKGLTPNQIMCFLIGEKPPQAILGTFRHPSAMNEVYRICVKGSSVDFAKMDRLLDLSMDYLVKKMQAGPLGSDLSVYYERLAKNLRETISELVLISNP